MRNLTETTCKLHRTNFAKLAQKVDCSNEDLFIRMKRMKQACPSREGFSFLLPFCGIHLVVYRYVQYVKTHTHACVCVSLSSCCRQAWAGVGRPGQACPGLSGPRQPRQNSMHERAAAEGKKKDHLGRGGWGLNPFSGGSAWLLLSPLFVLGTSLTPAGMHLFFPSFYQHVCSPHVFCPNFCRFLSCSYGRRTTGGGRNGQ